MAEKASEVCLISRYRVEMGALLLQSPFMIARDCCPSFVIGLLKLLDNTNPNRLAMMAMAIARKKLCC